MAKRWSRLHVRPYHGELTNSVRREVERQSYHGELNVIVCTIAYGLGVDKPDIRTVVDGGMPEHFGQYWQQAGRDG